MSRFSDTVLDERDHPIPGVLVYVFDWDVPSGTTGALVALTDDDLTTALSNPLTTDEFGQFYFNTAIGVKLLEFHYGGKLLFRQQIILTPAGVYPGNDAALRADLAATDGDVLVNFTQAGTGAAARTLQSKLRDLTVSPKDFAAFGGGTLNDTAAVVACCTYAFANGLTVDGQGQTFGVSGTIEFDSLTAPRMRNIELKQLTPAATNRRTLFFNGCDRIRMEGVRVNRGTDKTSGSLSDGAGIWITGGTRHQISNVEVFGDGKGSGFVMTGASKSVLLNVAGHDMGFDEIGATDDRVQGVWIDTCSDCTFISLRSYNLTGNATGQPVTRYTRGVVASGNARCAFIAPFAQSVDQGMDMSGSAGNIFCSVSDIHFKDVTSYGLKIANSGYGITVNGGVVCDPGLSGVVISGPAEASLTYKGEAITVSNVKVYNPGSNPAVAGSRIAFRVMQAAFDVDHPIGVTFIGCEAYDTQNTPTMAYGFHNDVLPDTTNGRFNRLIGCRSYNHITAASLGFHNAEAQIRGSSTQSITNNTTTVLTWNTEDLDSSDLHSVSVNTSRLTPKIPGYYRVHGRVGFADASSTTGYRMVTLQKNGTNIVGGRSAIAPVVGTFTHVGAESFVYLNGTDYIEVAVLQTSGGALNADLTESEVIMQLVREA